MKITNGRVYGFESAIRGMRNPKNSWDKSDSYIDAKHFYEKQNYIKANREKFVLGQSDKVLSQQLTKAGGEHCKHLRMIQVWFDLEAPRYMWQEFDTYKHIEKISCSTMHKMFEKELRLDDFENGEIYAFLLVDSIVELNRLRDEYLATMELEQNSFRKEMLKDLLIKAKTILPESFLQLRTVNTNYQQLLNIYKQRKNHKLPVWKEFCKWIEELPYFTELTGLKEQQESKFDKDLKVRQSRIDKIRKNIMKAKGECE